MVDLHRSRPLHERAEARLIAAGDTGDLSPEEARALVHDLDLHRAELELQNQELRDLTLELSAVRDRFRDLFDFAPVGHLVLDGEGEILQANFAAGALLGCEREELAGRRLQAFIAPGSQDRLYLHQRAIAEAGKPPACEIQLVTSNGHARHVAVECAPVEGAERHSRVALLDISERVRAEAALLEAKEALERAVGARTAELEASRRLNEKIAEAVPLLLWIFDVRTRATIYVNGFAREGLGYGGAVETPAVPVGESVDPADAGLLDAAIAALESDGNPDSTDVTFRIRGAHGALRWLSSRIAIFERGADGAVVRILGASRDVTELRMVEERMRGLQHEAEIARERERRDLAAMLHDSVGQLLPLANTKLALLRGTTDEATAAQLREVERLIRDAHAAATSLTFRLAPPALREIGLIAGFQALAREMQRDHGLVVEIDAETAEFALSDALQFAVYRVVHELLVNVAKHSGASEARVRMALAGTRLRVSVEDRGRGFLPDAGRLRGLGLESAEERLAYLGGRVMIESEPGRGTRVDLQVPLLGVDGSAAEPADKPP